MSSIAMARAMTRLLALYYYTMKVRNDMAILAIFTGNNITKQMYESLRKNVDWEHKHPTGGIFHAAAFDDSDNNIRLADIWESEGNLNKFVNERLMPAM
jgi:hypothetical protein